MDDFLSVLPAIIFWTAVVIIVKRVRREKAESRKRPRNDAQRGLVNEVIAAIERSAPDFNNASVTWSSRFNAESSGGVYFSSLSGYNYSYNYASHGYSVSEGMAYVLANEIAKHFGGECREYRNYLLDNNIVSYSVIGPHQLAAEQQKKHRFDNLRQL